MNPRTKRRLLGSFTLIAAFALTACLDKEITHTLYLQADGSVTWSVDEAQVRSDEGEQNQRDAEEREYVEAARREEHTGAAALWSLLPEDLEATVLRERRPYHVLTVARYSGPAELLRRALDDLCLIGDVTYEKLGRQSLLTVTVDVPASEAAEDSCDDDGPLGMMLFELDEDDRLRVVLEDGHFTDAIGFDIDGPVAIPQPLPDDVEERQEITWGLAWTNGS